MAIDRRREFPITQNWVYLNHALISPLPASSTLAATRRMHSFARSGLGSYKAIRRNTSRLLDQLSVFLDTPKDNILLFGNLSEAVLFLRHRFPVTPGKNIIGVGIPEAHRPAWNLWNSRNIEVVFSEADMFDDLTSEILNNAAILALNPINVPQADFQSIGKYADCCKENGSIFLADLSFAAGINQISPAGLGIDILLLETHRWMLGTPDLVVMCVTDPVARSMRLPKKFSLRDVLGAEPNPTEQPEFLSLPSLFDQSGLFASQASLAKSIQLLEETGIVEIQNRISAFNTQTANGLREEGFSIAPQTHINFLTGILAAKHVQLPAKVLCEELFKHRIQVGWKQDHLWISPHFYNNENDLQKFLDAIRTIKAIHR